MSISPHRTRTGTFDAPTEHDYDCRLCAADRTAMNFVSSQLHIPRRTDDAHEAQR